MWRPRDGYIRIASARLFMSQAAFLHGIHLVDVVAWPFDSCILVWFFPVSDLVFSPDIISGLRPVSFRLRCLLGILGKRKEARGCGAKYPPRGDPVVKKAVRQKTFQNLFFMWPDALSCSFFCLSPCVHFTTSQGPPSLGHPTLSTSTSSPGDRKNETRDEI